MEPWLTKDTEDISPFEQTCFVTGKVHDHREMIYVPYSDEVYIHRSQVENYVNSLRELDKEEKEGLIKELNNRNGK